MKTKILIIIATSFVAANAASDRELWNKFKLNHSKTYRNAFEEQFRFNIFQTNLRKIEQHNRKYGEVTYKLGINKFADLSQEEFSSHLKQSGFYKEIDTELVFPLPTEAEASKRIDWREQNAISPVKDQGNCDGSFYFAALGIIESYYYLSNGGMIDLSEQCLLDCSLGWNNGCNGGGVLNTLDYIRSQGVTYEQNYTYSGIVGECRRNSDNVFKTMGFVIVPRSEEFVQTIVGTVGPVAVTFDGSNLHLYSEGVYNDASCNSANRKQSGIIVGYDVTSDGQKYWIVKVSWGTSWGEGGYVRMVRDADNQCGIASEAIYPTL